MTQLEKFRDQIASRVRQLRAERRWTQAELAKHLEISQNRLSELERGKGSFTAEQLLVLARLFNVAPAELGAVGEVDEHAELQNALARAGAVHLVESEEVVPRREDLGRVVHDVLISGVPRLVTALAPVLVLNIDRIKLAKLRTTLSEAGFERRLFWLFENVLVAVRTELGASIAGPWRRHYRRAEVVLDTELESARTVQLAHPPRDLLDPDIRSAKTRDRVEASASELSRRWGIVTRLQPDDFARALEAARDHA